MAWWENKPPGTICNVLLFQVDLGGHSAWAVSQDTIIEAYKERREFARELESRLSDVRFDRLHWLGDGGLFAREFNCAEDTLAVCAAADAAFKCFNDRLSRARPALALRATATLLPTVHISKHPGDWLSQGLNEFLKFERDIAMPNAFVVTDELRRMMDPNSDCFNRFKSRPHRRVMLPNGISISAYEDERHPPRPEESPKRFKAWLSRQTFPPPSRDTSLMRLGWKVGDTVVVDTAFDPTGYRYIDLRPVEPDWAPGELLLSHSKEWQAALDAVGHLTGTKASITRVQPPVVDDPVLRLSWQQINYGLSRAFHHLVEGNEAVWKDMSQFANELDPRQLPCNFVMHTAVITGSQDGTRHLLLSHRRKEGRPGGYYNNRWSASFEEQFAPTESYWGGRPHPADSDFRSTVVRGAKEEFLGEDYRGTLRVTLHALQVEVLNLNLGMMCVVDLPDATFVELARMWPAAVDSAEHDSLAAVPLNADALKKCMAQDSLPSETWASCLKAGRLDLSGADHLWHPTSKARLALCLWLLEIGSLA